MLTALAHYNEKIIPLNTVGFNIGCNGAHAARTLMLGEITSLLTQTGVGCGRSDYAQAVTEENVLSKSTASSRKRTFEHLVSLYAMDRKVPIFRLLCHFWELDLQGRALILLAAARARDPLLELGTEFILALSVGEKFDRTAFERFIEEKFPGRFSKKMRRSLAQNIASTFTQVGFLEGKIHKVRRHPKTSVGAVALSLALSKLAGIHGISAWQSPWARILCLSVGAGDEAAREASRRGWIDYRRIGEVVSLSFRHLAEDLQIPELA